MKDNSVISSSAIMQDDKKLIHASVYLSSNDMEIGKKICTSFGCNFSTLLRFTYRVFIENIKEQTMKMNNGKKIDNVQKFLDKPETEAELYAWLLGKGFMRK